MWTGGPSKSEEDGLERDSGRDKLEYKKTGSQWG